MATVVLVPGTTAGGWIWGKIAPRLRDEGHIVYTPTLTGLGERARSADWPIYEVDTVHQITPDPLPKADVLVRILREHAR